MTTGNHLTERRKHYRFKPQDYVFASLTPHSRVLGRIVDISIDGLAFCYPAKEKLADESSSLTISWGDGKSRIEGIPFKIVWDRRLPDNVFPGGMVRHCAVRFAGLAGDQKALIDSLIQDCAEHIDEI